MSNATREKILLVDDEPDHLWFLRDVLTDAGFAIDTAFNGVDALNRMAKSRPDLIVVDAHMPQMNGFTFCEAVRKNPEMKTIPMVMLTGLHGQFSRLNGLAHGADAFLTKPYQIEELMAKITELLRRPVEGKAART